MSVYLKPDKTTTYAVGGKTLTVFEKIIPDTMVAPHDVASWVKKGQKMKPCALLGGDGKPRGITVHNTGDIKVSAETTPAEQYTRATFNGNMAGVVVHFYVWRGVIWQNLRLNERGWHAGDGSSRRNGKRAGQKIGGNLDTIAIEAIGGEAKTTETTALLCAWICKQFGFEPTLDVWQHADFAQKNCPIYIRPKWKEFIASVQSFGAAQTTATPVTQPKAEPVVEPKPTPVVLPKEEPNVVPAAVVEAIAALKPELNRLGVLLQKLIDRLGTK